MIEIIGSKAVSIGRDATRVRALGPVGIVTFRWHTTHFALFIPNSQQFNALYSAPYQPT